MRLTSTKEEDRPYPFYEHGNFIRGSKKHQRLQRLARCATSIRKKRAGMPADLAALVSELTDTKTVVTLVNTSDTDARTVMVQGGAYGEHRFVSLEHDGRSQPLNARTFTVRLEPRSGAKLTLTMKRYAEPPTITRPRER